ncbi:unnamed protein product [Cylicostephanus goldi]|uniref:Uncharacterized protein n=1 Tax=Cylicostephanus goldi TaxID=71465 RepID=A0A3P6RW36_CYLGO|nr:unnamed protein product [Cylicostephanus goldi]
MSQPAAATVVQPTVVEEKVTVPSLLKPFMNPGSYEELHRKARDVFPTCFEGAKVMVSKGLSSHFQVISHYIFDLDFLTWIDFSFSVVRF